MTHDGEYEDSEGSYENSAEAAMPLAAVGAAAFGALLGAAAWTALAHFAQIEWAFLAWGLGALVGFLAVKTGGRGVLMAVIAGGFAFGAIFAGKYAFARIEADRVREEVQIDWEPVTLDDYEERKGDAADWAALENKDSDEDVKEYLFRHAFADGTESPAELREILDYFRMFHAPELERFHTEALQPEAWLARAQGLQDEERASLEAELEEDLSPLELLRTDLNPKDLLFAALGILTAFGIVRRA